MKSAADVENQLLGVWTVESLYSELKSTGEKKPTFGEKPKGYIAFTPEKRFIGILTAENRNKPDTDEDRIAAFRSMVAYAGIYQVEGDRWITKVEVSWNEGWTGTEQMRFFTVEGDKLTINTPWLQDPNTPGNPEVRIVLIWRKVKTS